MGKRRWVGPAVIATLWVAMLAPPTASAEVVADASCTSATFGTGITASRRFAQAFTVQNTGRIVGARAFVGTVPAGTDFTVEIRGVDGFGVPTTTELASATVLDVPLTTGASSFAVTGFFPNPPIVTAGETYAISITDFPPGSGYTVRRTSGDICPGTVFTDAAANGNFVAVSGDDLRFDTFVDNTQSGAPAPPADTVPPDTMIVERPEDKTKKKSATFEFTSSEAGSTFQCSIDGEPFAACSSPLTVKVSKGKHTFQVRARDAAGNADPTEATASWTVKKKKR